MPHEEDIRVLSGAHFLGMIGVQSFGAECGKSVLIYHISKVLVLPYMDFLQLVRGTESIEEVDEGD